MWVVRRCVLRAVRLCCGSTGSRGLCRVEAVCAMVYQPAWCHGELMWVQALALALSNHQDSRVGAGGAKGTGL